MHFFLFQKEKSAKKKLARVMGRNRRWHMRTEDQNLNKTARLGVRLPKKRRISFETRRFSEHSYFSEMVTFAGRISAWR